MSKLHSSSFGAQTMLEWYRPGMTYGGMEYARQNTVDLSWLGPAIQAGAGAVQTGIGIHQQQQQVQQQQQMTQTQLEIEQLRQQAAALEAQASTKRTAYIVGGLVALGGGVLLLAWWMKR